MAVTPCPRAARREAGPLLGAGAAKGGVACRERARRGGAGHTCPVGGAWVRFRCGARTEAAGKCGAAPSPAPGRGTGPVGDAGGPAGQGAAAGPRRRGGGRAGRPCTRVAAPRASLRLEPGPAAAPPRGGQDGMHRGGAASCQRWRGGAGRRCSAPRGARAALAPGDGGAGRLRRRSAAW